MTIVLGDGQPHGLLQVILFPLFRGVRGDGFPELLLRMDAAAPPPPPLVEVEPNDGA